MERLEPIIIGQAVQVTIPLVAHPPNIDSCIIDWGYRELGFLFPLRNK